jgi:DNA-binding NtrC family response regulator
MDAEVRILVVDDDRYLLDLLIETLKAIGYQAHGVTSAREALDLLHTSEFDLIITDIKMPGINGVEFTRTVKRDHPDLPVIFVTGVFNASVLQAVDAQGFLAKPFRIGQMEELIASVLAKSAPTAVSRTERILVVDDDDSFRVMLMETLKLSGYAVVGAVDGREATAILEQGEIGTVITDVKLPGMDGLALVRHVKEHWPGIPVIVITGYLALDDVPANSLIDGFLMKPFKIESITELLESLKAHKTPPVG